MTKPEEDVQAADEELVPEPGLVEEPVVEEPHVMVPEPEPEDGQVTFSFPPNFHAPFRADGVSVFDRDGQRVAICGSDKHRNHDGPGVAVAVADGLNRVVPR